MLAAAMVLVLRSLRRARNAQRRPGEVIDPPHPQLRAIEKSVDYAGRPNAEALSQLDLALRHLARTLSRIPSLEAVAVNSERITVHFADPEVLPKPWSGDGPRWTMSIGSMSEVLEQDAPYPLLVSVGIDTGGDHWFVNLQASESVVVTGPSARVDPFARHLIAEVMLNPWSQNVTIETPGIGSELSSIAPRRLKLTEQAHGQDGGETASSTDAVTTHWNLSWGPAVDSQTTTIETRPDKLAVSFTQLASDTEPSTPFKELRIQLGGDLDLPRPATTVSASGLTSSEARLCAALVDAFRLPNISCQRVTLTGAGSPAEDTGGLQPPRKVQQKTPPVDSETGRLGPKMGSTRSTLDGSFSTRNSLLPPQSNLDEDIAEWFNPGSRFPKLRLLGPVTASAHGSYGPISQRKSYFVEMLAYIALHPDGVTSADIADAFSIGQSRARTDVGHVRAWLSTNPRTGRHHLPPANASIRFATTGAAAYQVEDVLVDWHLLLRLRSRASPADATWCGASESDLSTAETLVFGEPFGRLRDRGWGWLLDDERVHDEAERTIQDLRSTAGGRQY